MTGPTLSARAALLALCCAGCALMLPGCSVWDRLVHRSHDVGCSEKPFQGNIDTLPPLVVPAGLTPPDTRNETRIPTLNEPERVRAKSEPCLAQPPSYATGTYVATPTRSGTPIGTPAPEPAPTGAPAPAAPEPAPPGPSSFPDIPKQQ